MLIYDITFKLFLKDEPDYWVQLLGFTFGVGAMCGPIIVAIFKLHTFKILALGEMIAIGAFLKYPLPNSI